MSEKRDSNPRPRPWQGRALPTELFSRIVSVLNLVGSFAGAKIESFIYTSKLFYSFFANFLHFIGSTPKYSKPNLAKATISGIFFEFSTLKQKSVEQKSPTLKH